MTKTKQDPFYDELDYIEKLPKWIAPFRESYYESARLPFIVVYQAFAIANKRSSKVYKNKSAAIAIVTSQLQQSGCLLAGTNTLTVRGDIRELATMKRLGKSKVKKYIRDFESL